jgi:hypothetical protein
MGTEPHQVIMDRIVGWSGVHHMAVHVRINAVFLVTGSRSQGQCCCAQLNPRHDALTYS